MSGSGFILRFVDVVLILLFGFISISNLQDTEVNLPESTETEPVAMDTEEVVFIGVLSDGNYLIEDETVLVSSIDLLREHLVASKRALGDVPLKVRIRSSKDATAQDAFAVAAICDELGLSKALEVELNLADS
ncbi:MAG: ExbD/TolR family protein [Rhodothermales bacterium]